MFFTLLYVIFPLPSNGYSFCPTCIHSSGTINRCDLFKPHPLFKDNPEISAIGKEICGEKGKYFRCEDNQKEGERINETLFQEKIMRMVRD